MNTFLLDYQAATVRIRYSGGRLEADAARTVTQRLVGLHDRNPRPLLILGSGAIHTLGMAFPIDAWFLDPWGRVLDFAHAVRSARFLECPGVAAVLETPAGWYRLPLLHERIHLDWAGDPALCPLHPAFRRCCGQGRRPALG